MKSWLEKDTTTHNEGKSVVAERFIRSIWLQYPKCVYCSKLVWISWSEKDCGVEIFISDLKSE